MKLKLKMINWFQQNSIFSTTKLGMKENVNSPIVPWEMK